MSQERTGGRYGQGPPACLPVAQDHPLSLRRGDGELEWSVEVVLLLVRPVHNLAAPDHQEARVTQVRCVQAVATSVQNHDAGCAASYKQHGHLLTVSPGLLPISTHLQGAAVMGIFCLHRTIQVCPTLENPEVLKRRGVGSRQTRHTFFLL